MTRMKRSLIVLGASTECPEIELIFWYDMIDDPEVIGQEAYYFGLLRANYEPKPVFYVVMEI